MRVIQYAENYFEKRTFIEPFNEPARDLRIQNKPLWLAQRDVLAHTTREVEISLE